MISDNQSKYNKTIERKLSLPNYQNRNDPSSTHKSFKTTSCDSILTSRDYNSPVSSKANIVSSNKLQKKMSINVINCENIEIHFDREDTSNSSRCGSSRNTPKYTYNESPQSIKFNSPERHSDTLKCKNIVSYVQKMDISNNNSELDREDAHFELSEALISAFEIFKWNKNETNRVVDKKDACSTLNLKNSPSVSSPSSSYSFSNVEVILNQYFFTVLFLLIIISGKYFWFRFWLFR